MGEVRAAKLCGLNAMRQMVTTQHTILNQYPLYLLLWQGLQPERVRNGSGELCHDHTVWREQVEAGKKIRASHQQIELHEPNRGTAQYHAGRQRNIRTPPT
jgi:hypothetical protein